MKGRVSLVWGRIAFSVAFRLFPFQSKTSINSPMVSRGIKVCVISSLSFLTLNRNSINEGRSLFCRITVKHSQWTKKQICMLIVRVKYTARPWFLWCFSCGSDSFGNFTFTQIIRSRWPWWLRTCILKSNGLQIMYNDFDQIFIKLCVVEPISN